MNIKSRIASLLATVMALVGLAAFGPVQIVPSASAVVCVPWTSACQGGRLVHGADAGYDASVIVFCNWGNAFYSNGDPKPWSATTSPKYVAEGTGSNSDCGEDTDVVWVRSNEEVWCAIYPGPTYERKYVLFFDKAGPHKVNDLWDERCVLHRD